MICPKCGAEIMDGAKFCANCGLLLRPGSTPQPVAPATDSQATVPSWSNQSAAPAPAPQPVAPAPAPQPVAPQPIVTIPEPQPIAPTPRSADYTTSEMTCPETHLVKAILFTIFFCWPFGIPAIVNAAQVEKSFASGNYLLAEEQSQTANKWCKISLIVALVFWVLYILIMILVVLAETI